MAPQAAAPQAQNKRDRNTTVALDPSTVELVDKLRKRAGLAMLESQGFEIEPSRTDVIKSLVRKAEAAHENGAA